MFSKMKDLYKVMSRLLQTKHVNKKSEDKLNHRGGHVLVIVPAANLQFDFSGVLSRNIAGSGEW